MIFIQILILLLIPSCSFADIFSKSPDQGQLEEALSGDVRSVYYRDSYDYNAYAAPERSFELKKDDISLGCNRFDFHKSLKHLIENVEFKTTPLNNEFQEIIDSLSANPLLTLEYSSPTLADLYKHLNTIGNLKLNRRYQQCEDLEKNVDDPLVKLRKQALMDCLRNFMSGHMRDDIDQAFEYCLNHLHGGGGEPAPYSSLEDPENGNFNISGTVNVSNKVLDRVNTNSDDLTTIKQIIPRVTLDSDSVNVYGPQRSSRELISEYRNNFLSALTQVVDEYKANRTVNVQTLSSLSVFGLPLTETQVRNISILDRSTAYLAVSKIASNLAYLKTMDQYLKASQMLDRVMLHPAIEPGYKTLLKGTVDYVQNEIRTIKEEKERLTQYAQTMHSILNEADARRLKTLAEINEESKSEQEKGLFKLNA